MNTKTSLLCLVLLGAVTTASAAVITVDDLATNGSNIANSDILYAYHFVKDSNPHNTTYTVNGIAFAPIVAANAGTYSTADYGFTAGDTTNQWANNQFDVTWRDGAAVPAPTGALALLLDDYLRTPGVTSQKSPSRLTLKGFTVGSEYAIQLLHAANVASAAFDVTAGSATQSISISNAGPAKLTTITFTATGSSFDVDIDATTNRGFVNGFTVAVIPEPSTILLALSAFAGLLLFRPRTR